MENSILERNTQCEYQTSQIRSNTSLNYENKIQGSGKREAECTKTKLNTSGLRENKIKLTSHKLITSNKIRALQVHILFVQSFQSHKQGTTESKKHDNKYHAEVTHISINHLGQCSGVQTSGAIEKMKRLAYRYIEIIPTEQCCLDVLFTSLM